MREPDLTTNEGRKRFLMHGLGITGPQAKAMLRAYLLDQRDTDARSVAREEFGAWLQSNYWPSVTRRPRPTMATRWRVSTSGD